MGHIDGSSHAYLHLQARAPYAYGPQVLEIALNYPPKQAWFTLGPSPGHATNADPIVR